MGAAADNARFQNQPIDEYDEGDFTKVGGMRASGTRTTQTVTPTNQGVSPSTPALSGLPEGETPASWFYAQLCT
ncbi:hypothetical protein Hanom_Chr07g00671911 [Helianthus anomalus]